MLIKYAKRVTEILAELNPIEKDVYVKKISEDTGIREQAVYDLLGNELTKNFSEGNEMNNMEINGHKLYIEPAYMKAERALLKIMSSRDEYLEIIVNNIESSGFIVEAHKKIYELILKAKEGQIQNITEYIETHCNDVETSKEYVLIQEINFEESNVDYSKLLTDYIFQIKKHTLEEKKKLIMQKLKECEIKGLFEESLDYVKDLKIIDENLKGLERS